MQPTSYSGDRGMLGWLDVAAPSKPLSTDGRSRWGVIVAGQGGGGEGGCSEPRAAGVDEARCRCYITSVFLCEWAKGEMTIGNASSNAG